MTVTTETTNNGRRVKVITTTRLTDKKQVERVERFDDGELTATFHWLVEDDLYDLLTPEQYDTTIARRG